MTKATEMKTLLFSKLADLEGELEDKAMYVNDSELLKHIDEILELNNKIADQEANTPFWAKEYDLKQERENLESMCYDAKTLQDAILCGANMTYLYTASGDTDQVGYLREDDGTFEIYNANYEDRNLSEIEVEFDHLDEDGDGYTIALFRELDREKK